MERGGGGGCPILYLWTGCRILDLPPLRALVLQYSPRGNSALQYLPLLQMMLLNSMQHGGLFSASSDSSLPEGRLLLDAWAFHEHSYLCLVTFSKTRVPVASRDYSLSPRPLLEHRFGGVSEYTIYIFAYAKFSLDFNLLRCMLSENRSLHNFTNLLAITGNLQSLRFSGS